MVNKEVWIQTRLFLVKSFKHIPGFTGAKLPLSSSAPSSGRRLGRSIIIPVLAQSWNNPHFAANRANTSTISEAKDFFKDT